ncbi:isomerase [Streptomyces tremellae]|uniref:5-carboxymethyl-2-hydroxymuconate Delta-isomerase n=1 Tax=Streptomyces tremellae TaxID=1124239 RepID=A0ABP7FCR3_9ACTN
MPQIAVDYSAVLTDAFDRPAFASAMHAAVVEIAASALSDCKTRFTRCEETVARAGETGHGVVHVSIGLQPGRSAEVKARLTRKVVELLGRHVRPVAGLTLHASAEVRELDPSYLKVVR